MAESYFKDPLLAKWEQLCPVIAARVIANYDSAPNANAASVLADALGDNDGFAGKSILVLVDLIAAELSGARRARERAVLMRDGNASTENDEKYTRRQRERANAAKDAAQYILEAFDGE